ncbi:ATP-binding protein [Noviherbaspirillum sp. DKR-6]|uniref:ATP-binding protein n=2 Tax=Noviherbaspirillum pedocola TaxID=2801341 RepID=A0A934W7X8_9BURK|nr:ATP-binding protein [Noviherbaspirillum pedocola]
MNAVSLQVNVSNLVHNMRFSFTNSVNVLSEMMQNARRAGATEVRFSYTEDGTLVVIDNGTGIEDFQKLLTLSESGWDAQLVAREQAFGQGFFSALHSGKHVTVESRGRQIAFATETALSFGSIAVVPSDFIGGTRITIQGMTLPKPEVANALNRFAKGFSIAVVFNDKPLERPHALAALATVETAIGPIHVVGYHNDHPQLVRGMTVYLQGLPIYQSGMSWDVHNVVHLDSTQFAARMPDRTQLINETAAACRIEAALRTEQEKILTAHKGEMGNEAFAEKYWHMLPELGLSSMLLDIPYLPKCALHYAPEPVLADDWRFMREVESGVTRQSVEAGQHVLCLGSPSEESIAAHMLAYKKHWMVVSNLPAGHWAEQYQIDLYERADDVVFTLNGVDGQAQTFNGLYLDATVRFCDSVTLSLDQHSVTFDDEAVFHSSGEVAIPGNASGAGAVMQACSYIADNEEFQEADRDTDDQHLQALVALHRTKDLSAIVRMLLSQGGAYRFDALRGHAFNVVVDDRGELTVTSV